MSVDFAREISPDNKNPSLANFEDAFSIVEEDREFAVRFKKRIERDTTHTEKMLEDSGIISWITGNDAALEEKLTLNTDTLDKVDKRFCETDRSKLEAEKKLEEARRLSLELEKDAENKELKESVNRTIKDGLALLAGTSYTDLDLMKEYNFGSEAITDDQLESIDTARGIKTAADIVRDVCIVGSTIVATGGTGSVLLGIGAGSANGLISNAGIELAELNLNNKSVDEAVSDFSDRALSDIKNASITGVSMGVGTLALKGSVAAIGTNLSGNAAAITYTTTSASASGLTASSLFIADEYRLAMEEFNEEYGHLDEANKTEAWDKFAESRQLKADQIAVRLLTDTGASIAGGFIGLRSEYLKDGTSSLVSSLGIEAAELTANGTIAGAGEYLKAAYSDQDFNTSSFTQIIAASLVGDSIGSSVGRLSLPDSKPASKPDSLEERVKNTDPNPSGPKLPAAAAAVAGISPAISQKVEGKIIKPETAEAFPGGSSPGDLGLTGSAASAVPPFVLKPQVVAGAAGAKSQAAKGQLIKSELDPEKVSEELKKISNWLGVTGPGNKSELPEFKTSGPIMETDLRYETYLAGIGAFVDYSPLPSLPYEGSSFDEILGIPSNSAKEIMPGASGKNASPPPSELGPPARPKDTARNKSGSRPADSKSYKS